MNVNDLRDPQLRQQLQQFIRGGGLDTLSSYELQRLHDDIEAYERALNTEAAQKSLIEFCKWMDDSYKPGKIHYMIADRLEAVCRGDLLRLAVSLPPRAGKSRLISELFPAWYLGHHPDHKLMATSNNTDLAEGFGRKVRNNIDSSEYQQLFPETKISRDSSSAGRWATTRSGEGYYIGVGGALAGRGAHLCLDENALVLVDDTETPLKAVKVGDSIHTPTGREKITAKSLTIHNTAIKINQQVTASAEHRFATTRGWVTASQLRVGDKLIVESFWRKLWLVGRNIHRNVLCTKRGEA